MEGVPIGRGSALGGPLGDASVAADSGALDWDVKRGPLSSPLDPFWVALTFPPPLAPPSLCLLLGSHHPQLSASEGRAEGVWAARRNVGNATCGRAWKMGAGGGGRPGSGLWPDSPLLVRRGCPVVPRALIWGFGFIPQDVPDS